MGHEDFRVRAPLSINFGAKNNSIAFLEGASEQKRNAYRARASKIKNKSGEYTYKIKYTPNFLSFNILWYF